MKTFVIIVVILAVLIFAWKVLLKDPFGIYPKK